MEMKKESEGKRSFIQLIKFGLVGVSNTLIDFIVTNLLVFIIGFNELWWVTALYNGIGYGCGVLNSFLLNSRWTFKKEYRRTKEEVFKFILVNLISYGLSFLLVLLFSKYVFASNGITDWTCSILKFTTDEQRLKMVRLLSKVVSAVCVVLFNFVCTKLFVFTGKDASAKQTEEEK